MQLVMRSGRGLRAMEIAAALRDEIVSGRLPPGTRLGQDDLATRFDVSRIPVREALKLLEADGLVDTSPNRTAIVAAVDMADMIDIFDMRGALECLALALAIPHLSDAQIRSAEQIQAEMKTAPQRDFGALNARFHMTLYTPCGRPRLLAEIRNLSDLADRYLRLALTAESQRYESDAEHDLLLKACYRRDSDEARQVLAAHIQKARDGLKGILAER